MQYHDDFYYRDAYAPKIRWFGDYKKLWPNLDIKVDGNTITIEQLNSYATKRNKRIAIRRALYTLGVLIAVWGMVWMII